MEKLEISSPEKKYYIVRHGLATYSKTGYGHEVYSAELKPEGIPPIERLAEYLKDISTDYNVSSAVLRCVQTTEIISSIAGKQFVTDPRLKEFYGEDQFSLIKRVRSFVEEMDQSEYQNILICTHGAVIAGLKHFLTTGFFEFKNSADYSGTGQMMVIQDKDVEILDFNNA